MLWPRVPRDLRVAVVEWPDRKRHGALDRMAVTGLRACLERLAGTDPGPNAVVLKGASTSFCAGADLRDVLATAGRSESERRAYSRTVQGLVGLLEELPCLTLAAVEGHALGLGFEMVLAVDVRWAAANASLGLPEARLGLLPAATGTVRMFEALGPGRGMDWLLEGRTVCAADALDQGLLTGVSPPGQVLPTVMRWIQERPWALTVAPHIRRVRTARYGEDRRAAQRAEQEAFANLVAGDAAGTRIRRRLENPKPRFQEPGERRRTL